MIISMALQVPELATSAYMVFFISKENKTITTIVGVLGLIGLTIGIAVTLLLYQLTYGHPELRIPAMAIALFLGMYLSRVLVLGPLAFLLGFVIAVTQSIGDLLPSPELVVRAILWLWVALAYAVGLTVVLNLLFLPKPTGPPKHPPKPKGLFVPDAFTNPAHVRFALKVTLAAMFCYILYSAIDWFGIHTAFITCVFIALESTGRHFTKVFSEPSAASLADCLRSSPSSSSFRTWKRSLRSSSWSRASRRSPAGSPPGPNESLTLACRSPLPSFTASFRASRDYAPSTDLDDVRNRVVGILFGLIVTALVFQYIWPERARIERPAQNEIVDAYRSCACPLRMCGCAHLATVKTIEPARSNDRRERRQTHARKTTLGRSGASTTVNRAGQRSLGREDFTECPGTAAE